MLSVDLRTRVVAAYNNKEGSCRQLAARFDVAITTVCSWVKLQHSRPSLMGRHSPGRPTFWTEKPLQSLAELVNQNPDYTLFELGLAMETLYHRPFDVMAIYRALKKLGMTKKKDMLLSRKRQARKPRETGHIS